MNLFDRPRKPSLAENCFYPLAALLVIFIIDKNVESVLLTPVLSLCLLGVLAFRLETKVLAFWFVILAINVICSLIENPGGKPGSSPNWETVVVRSFGFMVSGMIALTMNRGRSNLIRNNLFLLEMLELLPCGVVVSDSSATLLFANKKTTELIGKTVRDIIGYSFFPLFTAPEQRGRAIEDYLALSEQESPSNTNLTIMANGSKRHDFHATQIPMSLIGKRCIVTVIELVGENPQRQLADPSDSTLPDIAASVVHAVESPE